MYADSRPLVSLLATTRSIMMLMRNVLKPALRNVYPVDQWPSELGQSSSVLTSMVLKVGQT
jgi:hypothetical protein